MRSYRGYTDDVEFVCKKQLELKDNQTIKDVIINKTVRNIIFSINKILISFNDTTWLMLKVINNKVEFSYDIPPLSDLVELGLLTEKQVFEQHKRANIDAREKHKKIELLKDLLEEVGEEVDITKYIKKEDLPQEEINNQLNNEGEQND